MVRSLTLSPDSYGLSWTFWVFSKSRKTRSSVFRLTGSGDGLWVFLLIQSAITRRRCSLEVLAHSAWPFGQISLIAALTASLIGDVFLRRWAAGASLGMGAASKSEAGKWA